MDLVTYPDPILRKVIPDVDLEIGKETGRTLLKEIKQHPSFVGLAANQIGLEHRVCVYPIIGDIFVAVINPYIFHYSMSAETHEEGCGSLPGVKVNVLRAKSVLVRFDGWINKTGDLPPKNTLRVSGFSARVLQHEVDHLNGILITDYAAGT